MKRILITGAAGWLGGMFREKLADSAEILRLADINPIENPKPNEEIVTCDLGDRDAVFAMVQDCDAIMHFGGVPTEAPWSPILNANIVGMYNLYEAARAHGQPRILYASSNHAIGFHKATDKIDADAPVMPDSLYGVSKCFGEAIAKLYHSKFGQETLIVRIGSCFPEPKDYRMLTTWMGPDDLASLARRMLEVPVLGCPIVFGQSDNQATFWDNSKTDYLGWRPTQTAEGWRAAILERDGVPTPGDPVHRHHGGAFCTWDIMQDDG